MTIRSLLSCCCIVSAIVLVSCSVSEFFYDFDGDGSLDADDCNTIDATIYPNAEDIFGDGIDQNCDGVDGNAVDQDLDGFSNARDCDDSDPNIYPGADDPFGDGIDQNCDDVDGVAVDQDNDGYSNAVDCDDQDASSYPGADDPFGDDIDQDCDGVDGVAAAGDDDDSFGDDDDSAGGDDDDDDGPPDLDGDGYPEGLDCNDLEATVHPGAVESCDGVDNDCNGMVDGPDAVDVSTWYLDADNDGFGRAEWSHPACDQPLGWVGNPDDCDDLDPASHPTATELCDGRDNDCDTQVDESGAIGEVSWFLDADGDGFGDPSQSVSACEGSTTTFGYVLDDSDCNDLNSSVNPAADEACDSIDNDCDEAIDGPGANGELLWYLDADGDGWGRAGWTALSCVQPTGFVSNATDCNDFDSNSYPQATEVCGDGIDQDCNGSDLTADHDGDNMVSLVCGGDDCDDDNAAIYSEAPEVCDGFDNDCDPNTVGDDVDADGDLYVACEHLATQHLSSLLGGNDCDDTNSAINPGAPELCNGIDDDCNYLADDNAVDADTWYLDDDGDGYGAGNGVLECSQPTARHVTDDNDCDDNSSVTYPGAPFLCDGFDNSCTGGFSCLELDDDGDGYIPCSPLESAQAALTPAGVPLLGGGDCDDGPLATGCTQATSDGVNRHPGNYEICGDGFDNNCNCSADSNNDGTFCGAGDAGVDEGCL